jgi:hypothetical protein
MAVSFGVAVFVGGCVGGSGAGKLAASLKARTVSPELVAARAGRGLR